MIKNLTSKIIDYENGELPAEKTIELFADLVKTGLAWSLQGCYGRMASELIKQGYISSEGRILKNLGE